MRTFSKLAVVALLAVALFVGRGVVGAPVSHATTCTASHGSVFPVAVYFTYPGGHSLADFWIGSEFQSDCSVWFWSWEGTDDGTGPRPQQAMVALQISQPFLGTVFNSYKYCNSSCPNSYQIDTRPTTYPLFQNSASCFDVLHSAQAGNDYLYSANWSPVEPQPVNQTFEMSLYYDSGGVFHEKDYVDCDGDGV